ncbi:hypothetical protein ACFVW2_21140 [Streptomyces sp. NPDC058171]
MSTKPTGLTLWQLVVVTVLGALLVGLTLLFGLNRLMGGLLLDDDDCLGTKARADEISSVSLLGSPPEGARIATGWQTLEVGCMDGRDDELLSATRSYEFDGDHQVVRDHYRALAEGDGWTRVTTARAAGDPRVRRTDVCFEKELAGGRVLLRVSFDPGVFWVGTETALDDDEHVHC